MKVRVGLRGTIVLPKKVRDSCGISEGDVLRVFIGKDGAITLIKDDRWEKFHGCARGVISAEEVERELDEDEFGWEKRLEK